MRRLPATFIVATLVAAVTLAPRDVLANCGYGPGNNGWDAPDGAIVFTVGDPQFDVIANVMASVNETRSHTMLSHGTMGWASHSTMRGFSGGDFNWPNCDAVIKPSYFTSAGPGAEAIEQAAMWQFLYGDGVDGGQYNYGPHQPLSTTYKRSGYWAWTPVILLNGVHSLAYRWHSTGAGQQATDYAWNAMPWWPVPGKGFYRYLNDDGTFMEYSFFQYRDSQALPQGLDGWSAVANGGSACSTFAAFLQKRGTGGQVSPHLYGHDQMQMVMMNLWSQLDQQIQGMSQAGLMAAACFNTVSNIAAAASNQVLNCMAANVCTTGNNWTWTTIFNDGNATAASISPDRMAGAGVHTDSESVWAADTDHNINWNSPGQVYSCWD
jgi:hypothetical protein